MMNCIRIFFLDFPRNPYLLRLFLFQKMFQFHIGLMSEIELTHAHKIASEIEYAIEMEFHENIRS